MTLVVLATIILKIM